MTSKHLVFAIVALSVSGVIVFRSGHHHPTVAADDDSGVVAPPAATPEPDSRPPAPHLPAPVRPAGRTPPAAPTGPTEPSLMSELRDLGASDPTRALELAREGNRRFPDGAGAAERSWTICKSLAALGRSSEAQDEARRTVQQYPGTSWAADVRRHLLAQPLEDPRQRGYGKSSELD